MTALYSVLYLLTVTRQRLRLRWAGGAWTILSVLSAAVTLPHGAFAQQPLDPIRTLAPEALIKPELPNLPESYIWISQDASPTDIQRPETTAHPVYFRRTFNLKNLPPKATLYVAQSGSITIVLNGKLLETYADSDSHLPGLRVSSIDATASLRAGSNTLAIRVVPGPGSHHTTSNPSITQLTSGHVLVVKLVPAARSVEAKPLLVSDASWESVAAPIPEPPATVWTAAKEEPLTKTLSWSKAVSIGRIGADISFLQWNADTGLYDWPGYEGVSPFLRRFDLAPAKTLHLAPRTGSVEHVDSLVSGSDGPLKVTVSAAEEQAEPPSLMLDFGREVNGQLRLVSAADHPTQVSVAYGESEEEATYRPYLGARLLYLPPNGAALGPKGAFRYVLLRFPESASLAQAHVDGITYPVEYRGSFRSSDELLNRIWETGAYTAHLCMLDGIWDGAKRDRARWMGDLDVSGRAISAVFADRFLMEETLQKLVRDRPATADVNTISGYSPLWISGVADFYRRIGDRAFLNELRPDLLQLLSVMYGEFDQNGLFQPPRKETLFVDWSEGLQKDTPEARRATQLEFALGFREAAFLLDELRDKAASAKAKAMFELVSNSSRHVSSASQPESFGSRWQTNAIAVVSGVAPPEQYERIWSDVLSHVGEFTPETPPISPYYGYYVLQAMAQTGQISEALGWMRSFWGGMIAEGATSFWEAYDPRWPKKDFHAALEADNKVGYYASLAHGWSSGPTPWLMEHVLGIEPTGVGFSTLLLHPELAGLAWAEGTEPTPHGDIRMSLRQVDAHTVSIQVAIPPQIAATLSLPLNGADKKILLDGKSVGMVHNQGPQNISYLFPHPGTFEILVTTAPD